MGLLSKLMRVFVLRTEPSAEMSREIESLKAGAVEASKAAAAASADMKRVAMRNAMSTQNFNRDIRKDVGDIVASMAPGEKK